ncbi:MAG TPA: chitobiase/beta-hexosaminidase C-terminal domain-containing protein, partial [Methylomirabilota bacterium]|nr:chitobiase/beta-hexosaminidase C-terminal domain-containing protein [Methylomirabilota bacterium]
MTNVIGKFAVTMFGATLWLASVPGTAGAPADPLRFLPPGGVYAQAVTVRIEAGQGIIRFTRDGSDPGEQSPVYREPIELPDGGVLKARLFGGPSGSTAVVVQVYTVLDPGLREFDSNLPLVVLDTLGHRVDNVNRIPAALFVFDGGTNRAALASAVEFAGLASIKVRGHSS